MIGVTATSRRRSSTTANRYISRRLAAAAVLGVQLGSSTGLRLASRIHVRWLEGLLAAVLFAVGLLMLLRAR